VWSYHRLPALRSARLLVARSTYASQGRNAQHTVTHRLNVTKIPALRFVNATAQSQTGCAVFKAVKPSIKFGKGFDRNHKRIVVERLQKGKFFSVDQEWVSSRVPNFIDRF
jgi:hypothetical protein